MTAGAIAAPRSSVFTTSWLRARLRRRNRGAGPSTLPSSCPMSLCRAVAIARAEDASGAEQTTRISEPNGG